MPSPISEHTVPWPEADAARYEAEGYWAGIPVGHLLWQLADGTPGARALRAGDPGPRNHRGLEIGRMGLIARPRRGGQLAGQGDHLTDRGRGQEASKLGDPMIAELVPAWTRARYPVLAGSWIG
jgi:2,3-dihydroxybenzoate-AMP ligase